VNEVRSGSKPCPPSQSHDVPSAGCRHDLLTKQAERGSQLVELSAELKRLELMEALIQAAAHVVIATRRVADDAAADHVADAGGADGGGGHGG
jgi:hypothetical protein